MEEYINNLSKYEKPLKTWDKMDEASSAERFYDPYSNLVLHERLMSDYDTIEVYRAWIEDNKHLIEGKIVLDVGCGTGILSMLAAKAGAARVIGIEWSGIVDYTVQIIKDNDFDTKIFILKGRVDQVSLPFNIKKVDVIISLWMGYSLFQGDRLKAVIQARDKWLVRFGSIIPDKATLFMSGISDHDYREDYIDWWKNVYGYDMSCVIDDSVKHAVYKTVAPSNVVTNRCKLKELNLMVDSYKEVIKNTKFRITALRNDHIQGFMTHFTVKFSRDGRMTELNTDPLLTPKFWGQTVFYLKDYITVKKKEKMIGTVSFFQVNCDPRILGVIIGLYFNGALSGEVRKIQEFILKD